MSRAWLAFITGLALGGVVRAEDRVTFAKQPGAAPITIVGTILDYTGKEVTIRPQENIPQVIPVSQILRVQTYYSPDYQKAIDTLVAGDHLTAEPMFRAVLKGEGRPWVKREQLAWIMRCAYRRGALTEVASAFLELIASDPESQHWSMAPLIWAPVGLTVSQQAQAKSWMASGSPASQLIGASWMLQDGTFANAAKQVLDELARNTNEYIAQLARTQLWRLRLGTSEMSELTIEGWKRDLERIPEHLRAGPTYLIGLGYFQRQEYRAAAAEYLWLPTVYGENEPLAARACLEAAEALRRSGLTREAENLYREVVTRFPWSPGAAEARGRLAE
ncbi:MAG: hypothetical protein KDA90_17450 [Planctomycetaceae bacterium]|nr:hypothetical protein [Planctomycetaceae bacterium]